MLKCNLHHFFVGSAYFSHFLRPVQAWPRGNVYSYYSRRPQFDPELWHLFAHRARPMLNVHLDSFGKNHRLSTPCPMKWQYYE